MLLFYTLMPTEIHVLARMRPGETAADLARAIGNVVSRWVRQTQPLRSPVLAGPHRSHRLMTLAELRGDVRMLAWRPVHLGLCSGPSRYAHGALRIAIGLTPARGFDSRGLLQVFGETVPQAREALRAWIAGKPSERAWREWELTRGLSLVIGSSGPRPNVAQEVRGSGGAILVAAGGDSIDGALGLLVLWVVGKLGLSGVDELREGVGQAAVRGRALVACLAVRHGLCSAASVARYFGRAKATLSEQMKACKARRADQPLLATTARQIIEEMLESDGKKACLVRRGSPAAGS